MELTEWWNIIGKEQAVCNGPGIGLGPDLKNSVFDVVALAWAAALSTQNSVGTVHQQPQPKMPSLESYLSFEFATDGGFRPRKEVYDWFAQHFGQVR